MNIKLFYALKISSKCNVNKHCLLCMYGIREYGNVRSSVTRVAISHVYASVDSAFTFATKTSSITQHANGIAQGERKFSSRNCTPIVTSRYRNRARTSRAVPNGVSKSPRGTETFLVRGKLSQTNEESQSRKFAFLALTFRASTFVNSKKFTLA